MLLSCDLKGNYNIDAVMPKDLTFTGSGEIISNLK